MMPAFLELVFVELFCLSSQADQEATKVCQFSGKPPAKLSTMNSGMGELSGVSIRYDTVSRGGEVGVHWAREVSRDFCCGVQGRQVLTIERFGEHFTFAHLRPVQVRRATAHA